MIGITTRITPSVEARALAAALPLGGIARLQKCPAAIWLAGIKVE